MRIQQLSVFLENREGRLDEVLTVLGKNDVNIVAVKSCGHCRLWDAAHDCIRSDERKNGLKGSGDYSDADRCGCNSCATCDRFA